MQLYKIRDNNDPVCKPKWAGTQADAAKAKREMIDACKERDTSHKGVEVYPVNVPTDKQGLLAFLNSGSTH
jgi:hypothetical protein